MDTIREQLVKKAYSPDDKFKKYAVLAASLLVAILLATLVLLVLGRGFVPIAILFAGLVMWGVAIVLFVIAAIIIKATSKKKA